MKWTSLLNKVNFSHSPSSSSTRRHHAADAATASKQNANYESEHDFKRHWEEFRSASSEKEKQEALEMALAVLCKLSRQNGNPAELAASLADTRQFSFVIARAFISNVEKLEGLSSSGSLVAKDLIQLCEEETSYAWNVLFVLESLVSTSIDVQPLLDSGILSCLVHVLFSFLTTTTDTENLGRRRLQIEGGVIHVLKALGQHSGAAESLTDDDSLRLLFNMVVIDSSVSHFVHLAQLHRHVIQILGNIISSDNGGCAYYIHKHQLMKVLLRVVKEFDAENGDGTYAVGVVSLLLACVHLSYKPGARNVNLREDLQNAHGYHLLVQFALSLSGHKQNVNGSAGLSNRLLSQPATSKGSSQLSTSLMGLLDILIELAQLGPKEESEPGDLDYKGPAEAIQSKCFHLFDGNSNSRGDESLADGKIRDIFALQILQDIFLKSGNLDIQLELLDRLLRLLASQPLNYLVVQDLRTLSLFITNMPTFPNALQEQLLKVLEYVVTVVNYVPEQELLCLCCQLQQPIPMSLGCNILSFFIKLLSFDRQYKKTLSGVGVLDVLIENIKKCRVSSDSSVAENDGNLILVFENETTLVLAWDCLISLLKRSESNQAMFRKANGYQAVLDLLVSDFHRSMVLRLLCCIISEDIPQAHHEEVEGLLNIARSRNILLKSGQQVAVDMTAITEIFWAIWRILGSNASVKDIFGQADGFTLLTIPWYSGAVSLKQSMGVYTALLHLITSAVSGHSVNRVRLNKCLLSEDFRHHILSSGLICAEYEDLLVDLFLDVSLERVHTSPRKAQPSFALNSYEEDNNLLFPADDLGRAELYNAGFVELLIRRFDEFSSKAQLKLLMYVELLSTKSSLNKDHLTKSGCLATLLEIISPTANYSSVILMHAMHVIKLLGSYRISSAELRMLLRYMWQCRDFSYGQVAHRYIEALEGVVQSDTENLSLSSPVLDFKSNRPGHACVRVALGDRSWPPAAGYSFACWVQIQNMKREDEFPQSKGSKSTKTIFRIFSVESVEEKVSLAELYMDDAGVLTLATGTSSQLVCRGLRLEEGLWYHLVVVHNKPNVLAGLFQSSVASMYVNGSLRYTGKLGYSPSSSGKVIQAFMGLPANLSDTCSLSWQMSGCYLFEEVLTAPAVCLMYALGRGYRGLFQDTDLLRFVPSEACGGGNLAILDALETISAVQKGDVVRTSGSKIEGNGAVWELERLVSFWIQLSSKKLVFAFDGTPAQTAHESMVNLVDPLSAAASPLGGLPRFGRLLGDVNILSPCTFGDSLRTVGGVAVVLAMVEAAETGELLHLALSLLVRALQFNPRNSYDMLACRGYHLLALFLHRRLSLFGLQDLELLFQIAACEASFCVPQASGSVRSAGNSAASALHMIEGVAAEGMSVSDDQSSVGSMLDAGDFDIVNGMSDMGSNITPEESLSCVVLSNPDMMEHVLMDWTIWSKTPISIQLALLGFIERLVAVHRYRNHNLMTLRRLNIVQHLLVTLQRGDIDIPVVEKLVVLLGILLEDGFLPSELKYVADFVVMSFNPPDINRGASIIRESMGTQVIVRNILLEMLIDLQMTITSEEILDTWHKVVSSRIITFVLDEASHATSMRWVMTLLGVCLSSSATFAMKFRTSGGYQALSHVLPSFYDAPEIYYILFCLMFGKSVYPRQPEVRLLDFHALMPTEGAVTRDLLFTELLDSVLTMSKAAFDKMSLQSQMVQQTGDFSQFPESLAASFANAFRDVAGGDLQGEALLHKTYAARLMGGEAAAPALVTSLLRFMVDLAKMCRPFSLACKRQEYLESCVDLFFSCARSAAAVQTAQGISAEANNQPSYVFSDDFRVINNLSSSQKIPDEAESITTPALILSKPVEFLPEDAAEFVMENGSFIFPTAYGESNDIDDSQSQRSSSFSNTFTESSASAFVTLPLSPTTSERSKTGTEVAFSVAAEATEINNTSGGLSAWMRSSLESITPAPSRTTSSNIPSRSASVLSVSGSDGIERSESSGLNNSDKANFPVTKKLLLQMEAAGTSGGPCSAGAVAVLDLIAEILAEALSDQPKANLLVESALEAAPLHIGSDAALVFQGLCLSRLMNFLERRLLRDDEESYKKLDKNRWAPNLDAFSSLLVDRVYMGAFPDPTGLLKVLEFLLSMLQMANKHGRVEDAQVGSRSLLAFARGNFRQVEPFIQSLLRNINRIILYFFLPSVLPNAGEEVTETVDIITILQLFMANKKLILCPSNTDLEFLQCLVVNIIPLLQDPRQTVRTLAIDICKALLVYRKEGLQEILIFRQSQGEVLDIFHDGFDKLESHNSISFFTWFDDAHDVIRKVLDQRASFTWMEFIAAATRFLNTRSKASDLKRKKDMGKRAKDASRGDAKHWEQMIERRIALEVVRDSLSAELRIMRQVKYGWVIHAENEWQDHLQQLIHERGLWPIGKTSTEETHEWQLCSTEGPYRMRKKLVRSKHKIDIAGNTQDVEEHYDGLKGQAGFAVDIENPDYDSFFHIFSLGDSPKKNEYDSKDYLESFDDEDTESKGREEDVNSSSNEQQTSSSHNDTGKSPESGSKSGEHSAPENLQLEDPVEVDFQDDGEYLITPYLERGEKIKFRYNCERVAGLDKHDGIFLIGEMCLYVIENYYINSSGRICEKGGESEISVIDQALGVKSSTSILQESTNTVTWSSDTENAWPGGRAWAYSGCAWGKEKTVTGRQISHSWRMWKLDSVHELLKRWYQLRPVAIELFSMDGCNDLLVFHKEERDEVFKNLLSMNLPRSSRLETAISGISKQEPTEGGRLFKTMARSFSKRWQNGEISNFQYLMHLNTLAGRGYNDLTQYPVFPWIIADYESEELNLNNPSVFRRLDKPMGALSLEREDVFKKRYDNWDDPEIPKFHYGSHYSSAGTVLFYLIRLPPFSQENLKLQGGQFDHADRLFTSIRDTWASASQGNTADVKELIPEFFYLSEFLENRFDQDFGVKQSGEKVDDVILPPWAKGSAREFIRKHREALESQYVSENLHHWIDLIFGFRQRGQAALEATNVFYYLTYEGAIDIDSVRDPALKASTLAQINHFGQTPRQLFLKPHPRRRCHQKIPFGHVLRSSQLLVPQEVRSTSSAVTEIVVFHDRVYAVTSNRMLKPRSYSKYIAWGFPDNSLRIFSYEQDKLLSTHEGLHDGRIQCAGFSRDGRTVVTGGDDGVVAVWLLRKDGVRNQRRIHLQRALCAHSNTITCLAVSQPYGLIVTGSNDCTVIFWDLSSLEFVRQLPRLTVPATAVHVNDMTGEVVTAAGNYLIVWSINGDCLAAVNTSQLVSENIVCITSPLLSDWMESGWYVTGHSNGAVKLWHIDYSSSEAARLPRRSRMISSEDQRKVCFTGNAPEYQLVLFKTLTAAHHHHHHQHPVTALHLTADLKQLYSGDAAGRITSWILSDDSSKAQSAQQEACVWCGEVFVVKCYCRNCGGSSCKKCSRFRSVPELGYLNPVRVCRDCYKY